MPLILAAPKRAGKSSRGTPRVCGKCWDFAGTLRVAWTIHKLVLAFCVLLRRDCGGEPLSPPRAASSCVWTGRLQAGPDQNPTLHGQLRSASRAAAAHRRACAALTNTMYSAVCAADTAPVDFADAALLCALTFELRGRQRQDARPRTQTMCTAPAAWAWWPAVGAPFERGVRPHRTPRPIGQPKPHYCPLPA